MALALDVYVTDLLVPADETEQLAIPGRDPVPADTVRYWLTSRSKLDPGRGRLQVLDPADLQMLLLLVLAGRLTDEQAPVVEQALRDALRGGQTPKGEE